MAATAARGAVQGKQIEEAGTEEATLERYYGKIAAFSGTMGGIGSFLSGVSKAATAYSGAMGNIPSPSAGWSSSSTTPTSEIRLPQIPGVPTLEPVAKPMMSPREAGKPGLAIAEMGDEVGSMAQESQGLVTKKREAQMTVDKVAAQNQYAAADEQYQIQLKKTQNSRDIEGVVQQHQDALNDIAKQWGKSPAAVEIQMYGDGLRPRAQHLGDVREIDLMGKEWNTQTDLQLQSLMPQLVSAQRNGDRELSGQILSHVGSLYDEAVRKGLISKDDKDLALSAFRIGVQKQLNEASINSANPAERLQAIAQLKSGGSGPLDLTNLAPGDVSAMRVHAEETNQRLDNLAESQNLNAKLNIMNNAFQAPEFKHNFEAQQNALEDPKWLQRNGIVDANGTPDLVTAKKLSAEVERERTFRNQEQLDRDEKVIEKYSPSIDENKMSRADIDALPDEAHGGISNRARAQMIRQWTQNNTLNRQMATMDGRKLSASPAGDQRHQQGQHVLAYRFRRVD